jgi:hypothetical protein
MISDEKGERNTYERRLFPEPAVGCVHQGGEKEKGWAIRTFAMDPYE